MSSAPMSSQTFRVKCPNLECQRLLAVPSQARGQLVRCLHCRTNLKVPAAASTASRWQTQRS
ncbi:MAG: hypothetical protein MK095_07775 [Phycisphaerales bacterium]|nr:hypothetical protein [Phycisphaerales bacterium]